jgi:hypothetical protein
MKLVGLSQPETMPSQVRLARLGLPAGGPNGIPIFWVRQARKTMVGISQANVAFILKTLKIPQYLWN